MENILKIDLATEIAPEVQEVRGKDFIEYGTENWKNLYPQFIIDLYYNSSTQAAIINATAEMIAAENLIIEDEDDRDVEARVKLQNFMDRANGNESLHEVLKKVAFDFKLQGAFALNIVWSKDRTQIAEIYHVGVEKVRAERPNEFGKVEAYYISTDWSNTRIHKPYRVPAFNVNDRTSANQILYSGLYSPNMNVYHTPDYIAANNWALIDQRVAEFHLNNISNGFAGSYFISFANGVPTAEERFQIEQSLADKFTGASNSGKFVLTFSDDKNRIPEITPISVSDADKQYLALQELLVQNILTGHRVTSPMLMGIKSSTGLGNNADELNTAANFYLNTVVKPFQDQIVKELRKIFKVNNMDMPVNFVQLKPITTRFTNQDLMAVMTQDEIREELGLEPLEENVEVKEELAAVGKIDGDPVFNTIEEALEEAKRIGCEGYHEHEYEGRTVYMACKTHDEATSLSKCNCAKEEPYRLSDKTALQQFIDDCGEDIQEDWELLEEEVVDGEHLDFYYEHELNKFANAKIELARSITARPNAKSEQDGVNKSFNDYYKVRYVYATDNFLTNKSGTSREFCQLMVGANKVYRKEDIVNANSLDLNPGFGHYGTEAYNLFLYKGGPQCRHFWLRRIYKTSLRNAKQPINDDEVISYTKAISEGFTVKRNDRLVAIPPQRMVDNGYYPEN
tara:strand:+ start:3303 stop:5348 length:2046 start_codon:yes stop_codon:yes gene_type:complete